MNTLRIDKNTRSYIHNGETLSFDLVKSHSESLLRWLSDSKTVLSRKGSKKLFAQYIELSRVAKEWCELKHKICDFCLTDQLSHLEDKKVEVVDMNGNTRQFIVRRTSGWLPYHVEFINNKKFTIADQQYRSVKVIK